MSPRNCHKAKKNPPHTAVPAFLASVVPGPHALLLQSREGNSPTSKGPRAHTIIDHKWYFVLSPTHLSRAPVMSHLASIVESESETRHEDQETPSREALFVQGTASPWRATGMARRTNSFLSLTTHDECRPGSVVPTEGRHLRANSKTRPGTHGDRPQARCPEKVCRRGPVDAPRLSLPPCRGR